MSKNIKYIVTFLVLFFQIDAFATEEISNWESFLEETKSYELSNPQKNKENLLKIGELAKLGVREAEFILGSLLLKLDRAKAIELLTKASIQGCNGAIGAFGFLELHLKNEAKGLELLNKAAIGGDASSQVALANKLKKTNKLKAYSWFYQVTEQYKGSYWEISGQVGMLMLKKSLTESGISDAIKLAKERAKKSTSKYFCQQSSLVPLYNKKNRKVIKRKKNVLDLISSSYTVVSTSEEMYRLLKTESNASVVFVAAQWSLNSKETLKLILRDKDIKLALSFFKVIILDATRIKDIEKIEGIKFANKVIVFNANGTSKIMNSSPQISKKALHTFLNNNANNSN